MSSKTGDRIQALEIALNNESREKDFYLTHSKRTKNEVGKKMFASIAGDEEEHYRRILSLHKKLKEEGKWPETVPIRVKGTEVKAAIQKVADAAATSAAADKDDLEAVQTAIDFETKGEAFYAKLAREVENPMEKDFYALLSSMEREHRISLQDTLDYFKDPAGWYRIKERHHIDGA